jgi:hypothetical protein
VASSSAAHSQMQGTTIPGTNSKEGLPPSIILGALSPSPVRASGYALGIHMGFASFALIEANRPPDLLFPGRDPNSVRERGEWCARAKQELTSARQYVAGINSFLAAAAPAASLSAPDLSASDPSTCPNADYIVNLRSTYSATLTKGPTDLAVSYNLGVNIGIAEIHAASGEEVREVVIAALQQATAQVRDLGLNRGAIDQALASAKDRTAGITDVYQKVLSARSTYQSLL